jgi:hypothetical protein
LQSLTVERATHDSFAMRRVSGLGSSWVGNFFFYTHIAEPQLTEGSKDANLLSTIIRCCGTGNGQPLGAPLRHSSQEVGVPVDRERSPPVCY